MTKIQVVEKTLPVEVQKQDIVLNLISNDAYNDIETDIDKMFEPIIEPIEIKLNEPVCVQRVLTETIEESVEIFEEPKTDIVTPTIKISDIKKTRVKTQKIEVDELTIEYLNENKKQHPNMEDFIIKLGDDDMFYKLCREDYNESEYENFKSDLKLIEFNGGLKYDNGRDFSFDSSYFITDVDEFRTKYDDISQVEKESICVDLFKNLVKKSTLLPYLYCKKTNTTYFKQNGSWSLMTTSDVYTLAYAIHDIVNSYIINTIQYVKRNVADVDGDVSNLMRVRFNNTHTFHCYLFNVIFAEKVAKNIASYN